MGGLRVALDINKMILDAFLSPDLHKGEDSFGGKYCELLESTKLNGQITIPGYLRSSPYKMAGEYVSYINSEFEKRRELICQELHKYLVEHDGSSVYFIGSSEDSSYSFADDPSHTKYVFDYFGTDYQVLPDKEKEFVVRREPHLHDLKYKNHYKYPKSVPNDTAELKQVNKKYDSILVEECKAAEASVRKAKSALEEEYGQHRSRIRGFFGTVFSLLLIAFLVLPCIHMVHPIDYAWAEGWNAAIVSWEKGLIEAHGERSVQALLGYIPVVLTGILAGVIKLPYMLIELLSSLGGSWYAGGIAALLVLCLIGLVLINRAFPSWNLVRPRQIGRRKRKLDEAKKALEQVKAEQARKQEEYAQSGEYQAARAEYNAALMAYKEDKENNEAFAELWQRAWYDYIISMQ